MHDAHAWGPPCLQKKSLDTIILLLVFSVVTVPEQVLATPNQSQQFSDCKSTSGFGQSFMPCWEYGSSLEDNGGK